MAPASDSYASELRLKLHEGLKAHSASAGFPFVGGSFEQAILTRAFAELSGLSAAQVSALSIASDRLTSVVSSSFNSIISQLSPPQQLALRAGFDPFSPAVTHAINSSDGIAGLLAGGATRLGASTADNRSGYRFGDLQRGDAEMRSDRNSFAGLGLDSGTHATFKNSGLSRDVFDDLRDRYSIEQIRTAADFAQDLGVGADAYAGKFASLNAENRHDIQTFVEEMRSDPALTDEAKLGEIRTFRAEHPELQTLSDADLLNIVNAKQSDLRAEVGNDAAEVASGEALSAALGTDASVATQSKATTTARVDEVSGATEGQNVDDAFGVDAAAPQPQAATATVKQKAAIRTGPTP